MGRAGGLDRDVDSSRLSESHRRLLGPLVVLGPLVAEHVVWLRQRPISGGLPY